MPTIAPEPHAVGDAQCIADGEQPGRIALPLLNGFPLACFSAANQPHIGVSQLPNALDRFDQARFAGIIDETYTDPAAALGLLQGIFTDWISATAFVSEGGLTPATLILRTPNFSLVVIPGTDTTDQLAFQAMSLGGGPVDFGAFSTSLFWFQRSTSIIARMEASGVNFDQPIFFAGHSYGGVLVSIAAARILGGGADRRLSLLTFGMPRPGDSRLLDILAPTVQVHIATEGDPVPDLPPPVPQIAGMITPFPPGYLDRWNLMAQPRARLLLRSHGQTEWSQGPSASPSAWYGIVTTITSGDLPGAFADHDIKTYLLRLILTPP